MSEDIIRKYDENNNEIYYKNSFGYENWKEYDENNNLIHYKNTDGYECWKKYDENNLLIHFKSSLGSKCWYKFDENNNCIEITEKEFDNIEFRKEEKEYLSRIKCSRFELMEI